MILDDVTVMMRPEPTAGRGCYLYSTMASFRLQDARPTRLRLAPTGPHRFGGWPTHRGITPPHTNTPLHLLLLLDLADANCSLKADGSVRFLPLYYPLKYGLGGPSVQYAVLSEDQIDILYMSDEVPDAADQQYVRVPELPASSAEIIPLRYEEARILAFAGGYFQPNADDRVILDELNREHPVILIGGDSGLPVNAGDVICRNRECEFFNRRVWVDVIARIPPVPINGAAEFWHEYEGGNLEFYFCICRHCGTIIAFNVAY